MDTGIIKKTVASEIGGIVTSVTPKGITVAPFSKDKNKETKDISLSHSYNNYDRYNEGDPVVVVTYNILRYATNEDYMRLDVLAQFNNETPKHPTYIKDSRVEIETPREYKDRKEREAREAQEAKSASRDEGR